MGRGTTPGSIHWVELRQSDDQIEIWSYEVEDVGDSEYIDLYSFPETGNTTDAPLGVVESAAAAVAFAQSQFAAAPDRWLNQGVIQDLYAATKA